MLIAQTWAGTWQTISPLVFAVIGGVVAYVFQQILLKAGLHHRFTEHLWRLKFERYENFVSIARKMIDNGNLFYGRDDDELAKLADELALAGLKLQIVASRPVNAAAVQLQDLLVESWLEIPESDEMDLVKFGKVIDKLSKLVVEFRNDLAIASLSHQSELLMPKVQPKNRSRKSAAKEKPGQ